MKMFIHSMYGILDCEPMTLQAIEKSITESEYAKNNQFSEVPGNDTDIVVDDSVETDEE